MKKIIFTLLFVLFLISMINDLSKPDAVIELQHTNAVQIKIKPGDTVLSIAEEINSLNNLNINKIITDFQELNPGTDYQALIPNTFYYFPLYNDSQ